MIITRKMLAKYFYETEAEVEVTTNELFSGTFAKTKAKTA